jgi:hypothetical protein
LTLNGSITAEGNAALQDDGGGGSGGSVWLTAGALTGNGAIMAEGGDGEVYGGGGGGGGRIAIHTPFNYFDGVVSVAGGAGATMGQTGSVFYALGPEAPHVVSSSVSGTTVATISSVDIVFDTPINPYLLPNVSLTAPGGVNVSGLTVSATSPYRFHISFPVQTAPGNYTLTVGPQVQDFLGRPMSEAYTSAFAIVWAVVSGAITDANGLPAPGVLLQPDGGLAATTTDAHGHYALAIPPTAIITVVPSNPGLTFVPASLTYVNLATSLTHEDYLAVRNAVGPALTTQVQASGLVLRWYGVFGVTNQVLYSTDLVDWHAYGAPILGTNGPSQFLVPIAGTPRAFFRLRGSY